MESSLIDTIRSASLGTISVSREMAEEIAKKIEEQRHRESAVDLGSLTAREMEIFRIYGRGYSSRRTAKDLGLSRRTIETHINSIYNKLGIRNRDQLLDIFYKRNLYLCAETQESKDLKDVISQMPIDLWTTYGGVPRSTLVLIQDWLVKRAEYIREQAAK
jgi:DNA-binding CsgD family transcriptional regulator